MRDLRGDSYWEIEWRAFLVETKFGLCSNCGMMVYDHSRVKDRTGEWIFVCRKKHEWDDTQYFLSVKGWKPQ